MSDISITIFQLIVLYASMVIHEVSHGLTAYKLGDPTPKLAGRLTFNPLKHIDPFGTVLLPMFLILFHSPFVICYAKPVPFNPDNFRNVKKGIILTGLAGPLSNISLAVIFSILIRLLGFFGILSSSLLTFLFIVVFLNLLFAFFNLAPFPPFDGHHIFFSLLPDKFYGIKNFLTGNYFFLMLIWVFLAFPYLIVPLAYRLSLIFIGSA
ncbi:MAG: site-2 protease family protein [bacterium]|nr:site-2 protease family protein [bacterium]